MMKNHIAHVRKSDGMTQSVETHLSGTSAIAKILASKLNLGLAGELLGLMHDFGKYSSAFQKYIQAATGINPDVDVEDTLPGGQKIDHSTAGAQWIHRRLKLLGMKQGTGELCGQLLGLCIASHHVAGLIDCLSPEGEAVWLKRFQKDDALTYLQECEQRADAAVLSQAEGLAGEALAKQLLTPVHSMLKVETNSKIQEFYLGCFARFLFSCLIDADRINSADFEREKQTDLCRLAKKNRLAAGNRQTGSQVVKF